MVLYSTIKGVAEGMGKVHVTVIVDIRPAMRIEASDVKSGALM